MIQTTSIYLIATLITCQVKASSFDVVHSDFSMTAFQPNSFGIYARGLGGTGNSIMQVIPTGIFPNNFFNLEYGIFTDGVEQVIAKNR